MKSIHLSSAQTRCTCKMHKNIVNIQLSDITTPEKGEEGGEGGGRGEGGGGGEGEEGGEFLINESICISIRDNSI